MTGRQSDTDELTGALEALDHIAQLVSDGPDAFDRSRDRQLALTFCWANVGSQLKQFERKVETPPGTDPLTPCIRMRDRLVYGRLNSLRTDIVWDTCVHDGPRLRAVLAELLGAV